MSYLNVYDNLTQTVQRTGLLYGKTAKIFTLLGRRAGFTSTTTPQCVKEFDNTVALFPTLSNNTLDIISSSGNDIAGGTGVRSVKVTYINTSNVMVQSAEIFLNGTNLVTSVLTGVNEVLWMETYTAGSLQFAAGNIRLRINGGSVEVEQISQNNNKSLSLRFFIPTGYTGFLLEWRTSTINADQDIRISATVDSFDGSLSTSFHTVANAYTPLDTSYTSSDLGFVRIPALARVVGVSLAGATAAAARVDMSLSILIVAD